MVLAGSISLPFLLQDLEISELVLNELERVELPRMLKNLVEGDGLKSWTEATYTAVLSRIDGPFPFFIDRAFQKTENRRSK